MKNLSDGTKGLSLALCAFAFWGLIPIFWKQLHGYDAYELLCHRIIWGIPTILIVLLVQGRLNEFFALFREPRKLKMLLVTSFLILSNWWVFMYAVLTEHIVESSLGYFLNPLLNVVVGVLFLKERLRFVQWLAIGCAFVGMSYFAVGGIRAAWISICLAGSFCLYGYIRKIAGVPALVGLLFEMLVALIPALLFLINRDSVYFFEASSYQQFLAVGAGPITVFPLLAFAMAVGLLNYSTVGIIQYLTPTSQLILGVWLYGESFRTIHAVTFAFIWLGIILYTGERMLIIRRGRAY